MRRKTIAKRIIDCKYEEQHRIYDESATELSRITVPCQRQRKRRKQMSVSKESGEENSQSLKVDNAIAGFPGDGDNVMEILGGLQSCSKADLITMVLSMHREMDSLREQIRCLTACGKLAQNLESLVQTTDYWLSNTTGTTSPRLPKTFEGSDVPTVYTNSIVTNGTQSKTETANHYQGVLIVANDGAPEENTPPLFQDFITADVLEHCNTGTTAQKLTNDLLRGLYERDCMASHSISGIVNNKRGQPKPALPAHEVQAILRAVQHFFPGKTDSEIKGYIRQKLQNEAKQLRKKHHPANAGHPATAGHAASDGGTGSETSNA